MSYDLNFWKQTAEFGMAPQLVYERLSSGESVEGLTELPIDEMVQRIAETFADWQRLDEHNWQSGHSSFQLFTTPQFLRVDCYDVKGEDMNMFIDVADAFGCPLYDPQVGKRYDTG